MHRITGTGIYVGAVIFSIYLLASTNPNTLQTANAFFGSIIGQIFLVLYVWGLVHHGIGGLKHLVQDTGKLLGKQTTTVIAIAQPIVSVAITITLYFTANCFVVG